VDTSSAASALPFGFIVMRKFLDQGEGQEESLEMMKQEGNVTNEKETQYNKKAVLANSFFLLEVFQLQYLISTNNQSYH
jgi:hypothetical protein